MALRAGRVGVNPRIVDNNGNIKGLSGDSYTKTETDALLNTKADLSSLRANAKTFQFAYSGGKYGYKAGPNGTFHPFEEAGVTLMGWVKPAELSREGLIFHSGMGFVYGGYTIKDNVCYVDLHGKSLGYIDSTEDMVTGLPICAASSIKLALNPSSDPGIYTDYTIFDVADFDKENGSIKHGITVDTYWHIFGQYLISNT